MKSPIWFICLALWGSSVVQTTAQELPKTPAPRQSIRFGSPAFARGKPIPADFTCDGKNISPLLRWSNAPTGTKSFALICDDPDAPRGDWVHWVVYGIPANALELPENVPANETSPDGSKQGMNSFNKVGFGGPCPPSGRAHRYFFRLFALDTDLDLKPKATKAELETAMKGHVLGMGETMGTYQRK